MHRLETSVTQANAAWEYLLHTGKSFSKPVNEITPLNLRHVNLKKPKITLVKNESIKEKVSRKISALFVRF
jgi:hypothetical protein